jgi:nickel-dependent lactate racemase
VFLVNDAARTQPRHQAEVLGSLWDEFDRPTVLVATGTHRGDLARARDRLGGIDVEMHDADAAEAHVELAEGVAVDRRVAEADLVLSWGSVEPHYFGGWTGAHKTASIGILDRASITANHRNALELAARPLALEGNPVFEGIAAAVAALEEGRRLLAINQVLDEEGRPLHSALGTWRGSLTRCLPTARRCYVRGCAPADLVVACVEGSLARSLYQADKGIKNTEAAVRDGGELVLVADLSEGVGPGRFVELLTAAPDHASALAHVEREGYTLGDHKAVRWRALEARGVKVRIAAPGLDAGAVAGAGLEVHPDLDAAMLAVSAAGRLPEDARGLLVQDAGLVVASPTG